MDEREQILEEIKRLKQEIAELQDQFIDFELPKNYDKMSKEEKNAYHKKQDSLKQEAFKDINNYSVVKSHTMVSYPKNKNTVKKFAQENASINSIPLETKTFGRDIPEKFKKLHKDNLEKIQRQIERYNSTKAIRNDRVEFGANFNNFIETYFSKQHCESLNFKANKIFLETFDRQNDKNGNTIGDKFKFQNLTEEQKKLLIKTRIKLFAEKLGHLEHIAEIKVKNDAVSKKQTFMEKYGFVNNQVPYKNGAKKWITVKSIISPSGIDMAKNKRRKTQVFNATKGSFHSEQENKARFIELSVTRDKFEKFVRNFKGNGRQFSVEFRNEFPELAAKLYTQKTGNILFLTGGNLASSPISVQQHEIEKQIDEEFRKLNYRMRYAAKIIPASVSCCTGFLGKTLTNLKTQAEKELDKKKIKEYEKELRGISLREDLIGYESIFEGLNSGIKREFSQTINDKSFDKFSEKRKKSELKNFLSDQISKFKQVVHKDKFFSLGTEELEKLSGVLITRKEKLVNRELKNIIETLGEEQGTIYKQIIKDVKTYTQKYESEKETIDKLTVKLEILSNKPFSYENNNLIQKTVKDIDSHNKRLLVLKQAMEGAIRKKTAFETNFASKQITKAVKSTINKALSFNTAKSVFDKYAFPAIDAFGEKYYIDKNSIEGKQVERIVADFIMNFKNQIQNLKLTFSRINYKKISEFITSLEENLDDDFGSNIRDVKKAQKLFKTELDKVSKEGNLSVQNELEKYIQRLNKIESDLIKKFKAMNIEIGDVTLAKNKK